MCRGPGTRRNPESTERNERCTGQQGYLDLRENKHAGAERWCLRITLDLQPSRFMARFTEGWKGPGDGAFPSTSLYPRGLASRAQREEAAQAPLGATRHEVPLISPKSSHCHCNLFSPILRSSNQ